MTIDELVKLHSKVPGDIKIKLGIDFGWQEHKYFIPYFRDFFNLWHGLGPSNEKSQYVESKYWELYTEPKKKVKLYKWAYKNENVSGFWHESETFYSTEEMASRLIFGPTEKSQKIRRLDYTMIEVDVE